MGSCRGTGLFAFKHGALGERRDSVTQAGESRAAVFLPPWRKEDAAVLFFSYDEQASLPSSMDGQAFLDEQAFKPQCSGTLLLILAVLEWIPLPLSFPPPTFLPFLTPSINPFSPPLVLMRLKWTLPTVNCRHCASIISNTILV